MLDGFDNNPLCAVIVEGLSSANTLLVGCDPPVTGRYVSIRVVDGIEPSQFKLCNFAVITA